jgi:hypothetical protein
MLTFVLVVVTFHLDTFKILTVVLTLGPYPANELHLIKQSLIMFIKC